MYLTAPPTPSPSHWTFFSTSRKSYHWLSDLWPSYWAEVLSLLSVREVKTVFVYMAVPSRAFILKVSLNTHCHIVPQLWLKLLGKRKGMKWLVNKLCCISQLSQFRRSTFILLDLTCWNTQVVSWGLQVLFSSISCRNWLLVLSYTANLLSIKFGIHTFAAIFSFRQNLIHNTTWIDILLVLRQQLYVVLFW